MSLKLFRNHIDRSGNPAAVCLARRSRNAPLAVEVAECQNRPCRQQISPEWRFFARYFPGDFRALRLAAGAFFLAAFFFVVFPTGRFFAGPG